MKRLESEENREISKDKTSRVFALFRIFFMISATSVGGGLSMIPPIEAELTEKRKWLTKDEMLDCLALVQSMPGIIGGNIAAGTGYFIAGIPGALSAIAGMLCPPFFVILIIAIAFQCIPDVPWLANAFSGIRAGVCALILCSAIKLGKQMLKTPLPILIAVSAFLLLTIFPKISVIPLILSCGAIGILSDIVRSKGAKAQRRNEEVKK